MNQIKGSDDDGILIFFYILIASYAGCTANVALIHKNTLYVANAGDSRSVLCRSNGPFDMSVDHKPDNPEEKARIEKAGGFVNDGRVNGISKINIFFFHIRKPKSIKSIRRPWI